MLENKNINILASHVVFTIDSLFKDRNYPQELLDYLYLIAAGMILKYGDSFIDDIYSTMICTKFNFGNSFSNSDKYYKNPTIHNFTNKWLDLTCDFPTIDIKYEILFKNIDCSFIKTLEFLTHELNLILFTKNKKYSLTNKLRIRFDYFKTGLVEDGKDSILDRVFNILCTEEIIKNIISMKELNINNNKFKNALQNIFNTDYDTYKVEGLDLLVNLFRPLYKYDDIRKLINNNILIDNNLLEKEFDKVLGKNTYNKVCKKLNTLESKFIGTKEGTYNNYYALSIEYIEIRNEFINKYLHFKHLKEVS